MRKILFLFLLLSFYATLQAQNINVIGVGVTGRFNSCSGSNLPTISANLISTSGGASVTGGVFNCLNVCDSSKIRVAISGIRWNKSPNAEWLHGIFLPANAGFSVIPVTLPTGFIAYNAGCVGTCPSGSGTNGGPGFYFDNTAGNACCGTVVSADGLPCNNYGSVNIDCGGSFSMTFDLTFCNSIINSSSYQFVLHGTSDGETGCYNFNDLLAHNITFTIPTSPCPTNAINPIATAPVRTCVGATVNYKSTLTGTCSGPNIYWWNAATGGTLVGSGSPFVYDPAGSACPAGTTLYATCCSGINTTCVQRVPVTIPGVCNTIQLGAINVTNSTCTTLGSINSVIVNNAQGAVSYTLNPGGVTNSTGVFAGLNLSSYTIVASDAGLCSTSSVVNIIQPAPLAFNAPIVTGVSCSAPSSGQISISAVGGTGTLVYDINPTATQLPVGTFINLSAQTYTITVTDITNCSVTTVVNIASPPVLNWNTISIDSITCNGLSDAEIIATCNGGSGSIVYTFMPGSISNTLGNFNGIGAGNYTITAADALGCTNSTIVTIINPAPLIWDNINLSPTTCVALLDGSIHALANGGTGFLTYQLLPLGSTNTNGIFNGLASANYTLQVSDIHACSIDTQIFIAQATAITFNAPLVIEPICFGDNNGSIQINASGGTGSFTYNVLPGSINNTTGQFSNLGAGNYTVTVMDANGCTQSSSITISQPSPINFVSTNMIPLTCFGSNDGSIQVGANGGTGSINYTLQPSGISNSSGQFFNLAGGLYTITAMDMVACTQSLVIMVDEPNLLNWVNVVANDVSCNGGNDASLLASASGGTSSISYTILPLGINNASGLFTTLSAGIYTVQASDANGCSLSTLVNIAQPTVVNITSINTTDITCFGFTNGALQVNVNGGMGGYNFFLSPTGSSNTTGSFTNLAAGNYTIQVSDANGCTGTSAIQIITPTQLQINSINSSVPTCVPGNDAIINIIANGGTPSYLYSIGSGFQTANQFANVGAGFYTITLSDANGCTAISSYQISTPGTPIINNVNSIPVACNGLTNGSLSVSTSGGSGLLTYTLQPLGLSNIIGNFSSLSAGTYTVIVTDANACSMSSVVIVSEPPALNWVSINTLNVSCSGGSNASIQSSALGGVGSILYTLLPIGTSNSTGNFSSLLAGIYTLQASDANGCSINSNVVINEPSDVNILVSNQIDVSCFGLVDGNAQVGANGGTGLYTFLINPSGSTNTTGNFTGLAAGSYTIQVSDANGCTSTTIASINSPTLLSINSISNTIPTCIPGNDALLNISASGGSPSYSYSIGSSFQASNVFTNLGSGLYTITVSDSHNCTATSIQSILAANAPVISNIVASSASCIPGNDAIATITASGGLSPYNYSSNGVVYQTSNVVSSLSVGVYTMYVKDAAGCTATSVISIQTQASPIITSLISTNASCIPGCDASITINATGGFGAYLYSIDNVNFSASPMISSLCVGNYTATVKDANGCTAQSVFTINTSNGPVINSASATQVLCYGLQTGSLNVLASGGSGSLQYQLQPGAIMNTSGTFVNLAANNYTITVSDVNVCTASTVVNITQPPLFLFDSMNVSSSLCNGVPGGNLSVATLGGSGLISFSINPSATFIPPSSYTNLIGNTTYTIVAIDANNCSISTSVYIAQPNALSINNVNANDVSCFGAADGSLQISASGGTGVLSYLLMPGSLVNTNGNFNLLNGNTYTITVSDANGCSITTISTIIEPPAIYQVSNSSTNPSCYNVNDASISWICSGGSGLLNYTLQPGALSNTSGIFNSLTANLYTVTVSDAMNCSLTASFNVVNPLPIQINSANATQVLCNGDSTGVISITASGGIGILQYSITPLTTTNTTGIFSSLPIGTYTLQASDSNGCSHDTMVSVMQPNPLSLSISTTQNISCFGLQDGSIQAIANGGSLPYQYNLQAIGLSNASGNFNNLPAGLYSLFVSDANGCEDSINSILLNEPPQIVWNVANANTIVCYGDSNGIINVQAGGGSGSFAYQINPLLGVQSSPGNFIDLAAGTYTIMATDASGCTQTTIIQLNQNPALTISNIFMNAPVCNGDSNGSIQVTAMGGIAPISYAINGGSPSSNNQFNNLFSSMYSFTITDALGCRVDSNVNLLQPDAITIDEITVSPIACLGAENGKIIVKSSGGNGTLTYTLTPGLHFNQSGEFYFLAQGNYTLNIKDSLGCMIDTSLVIGPPVNPMKVIITKQDLSCTGTGREGWAFANIFGGDPPYSFNWNTTPPSNTAKIENLIFGIYMVEAVDGNGCIDRDTVEIEPGTCCDAMYIPNAFSPNGDGINDEFKIITSAGIDLLQFEIYNRWGNRVWRTQDFRAAWDGTFNNKPEATNTFFYIFRYKCITDGQTYTRKGDIMLLR
ncbi:MAG: gliding motility-associated C-terminal domain-containing protein [Bacteroidetes bacterium]|nr:gliding motility-associated C-terminal domain-containing protein [Bacteroidota bacterium]